MIKGNVPTHMTCEEFAKKLKYPFKTVNRHTEFPLSIGNLKKINFLPGDFKPNALNTNH